MYFQIAVSPPKPVKKTNRTTTLEEVAVLKLAPFCAIPKLFYENVFVGEEETKKIIIQNPNPYKEKLRITKLPPQERSVSLSWREIEIEAQEEACLELVWAPKKEGIWRDVLILRDSQNVNWNVPIVFKSVTRKIKKRAPSKTKPTVIAVPSVKKYRSSRSPNFKNVTKKRSPIKKSESACRPISYQCENCENNVHTTMCSPMKQKRAKYVLKNVEYNKENSPVIFQQRIENPSPNIYQPKSENISFSKLSFSEKINRMNNSSLFSSPTNVDFKCGNMQTSTRRETYLINSPEKFNDSLEMEQQFDNLLLTPKIPSPRKKSINYLDNPFIKKLNIDLSPELSVTRKIANLEYSPDLSVKNYKSPDSFIKKLDNITPEISIRDKKRSSDNFLVQKLLSDSVAFTTSAITKTPKNFQFVLNNTEIIEDHFYPNRCSTETKIPAKVDKNNSSTPKELFKQNNTFEMSPTNNKHVSPNLSGNTYTVSNISSSSTYILSPDDTRNKIEELNENQKQITYPNISTSSPLLSHTSDQCNATPNYLNFSGVNVKNILYCISEEQHSDLSIKDSSTRSDVINVGIKRKLEQQPEIVFTVSPPKRPFLKPKSPKPTKNMNTTWNKKYEKTERIRRRSISSLKLNLSNISNKSNVSDVSTSVNITQTSCTIDPFLIAAIYNSDNTHSNLDPFISSTMYYNEKCLERQVQELKKWLNALLTPPSELAATTESKKVDVAKLWQDCVKKDLIYAPSKEKISSKYHTNHKLEILRKSAKNLFHSLEIRNVLSKVAVVIENKQLIIREDKDLHLDVGLQSHVLTLLLCYNPLWLRIGLETIYNETIYLDSNSDVIGLSTFIMLRFFRCPDLMTKNKQVSHIKYLPTYAAPIKKFTLKKFLMLVFFLDQAKNKKLISHDPCLFCRDAPIKESKELLLSFSRELLSAVGDITKFLRRLGYEVSHKQNYIEEFDYAVKNLGVDLRDGIRLSKVMEIILLRNDLSNQLRGPAISRLQKIHNVKLALDSLNQEGYTIAGDISPKDIVDGHREKTLSLLWQIIYKFQAPRFNAAAVKIQAWWKSLQVFIKRRILNKSRQQRVNAVVRLQKYYRCWRLMLKEREDFLKIRKSTVTIQRFIRTTFMMKRDRLQFLFTKQAALIIQRNYRANKLMKSQRNDYLKLKNAVICVQQRFRAKYLMKTTRQDYFKLKDITIRIQRNLRSKKIVKEYRNNFLEKRIKAIKIQRYFRSIQQMKKDRNNYLQARNNLIKLQQRIRATLLMRKVQRKYLEQRRSIILLQQKYRATVQMKEIHKFYLRQKQVTIQIQKRLRANIAMKKDRENYLKQKNAAISIQRKVRAYLKMKTARADYSNLRQATIIIQQRFRANVAMKNVRNNYLQQKHAALMIQKQFRANQVMRQQRKHYLKQRDAVVAIQKKFRATQMIKKIRQHYLQLRNAALTIQRRFRSNRMTRQVRQEFLQQRNAAVKIQKKFKATQIMKQVRQKFLKQKNAAVTIQRKFKANRIMKQFRQNYLRLKNAAVTIQKKFRANQMMEKVQQFYLQQKNAVIIIQRRFRATQMMKQAQQDFLRQKTVVIGIQRRFRANRTMKQVRQKYIQQKNSAIIIQRIFRAIQIMKQARQNYLSQKNSTITIQRKFRAYLTMKKVRKYYLQQKNAAITIQRIFRANQLMKKAQKCYLKQKNAASTIQSRFRANKAMKQVRQKYIHKRNAAIIIQKKYRANQAMKHDQQNYLKQKNAVTILQRRYRAFRKMKQEQKYYLQLKNAAVTIQNKFRATQMMKQQYKNYLDLKNVVVIVQRKFRANQMMKRVRQKYLQKRNATITIQRMFRATQTMKQIRKNYLKQRNAIIMIQRNYRAHAEMRICRYNYLNLKKATNFIQYKFRANQLMKKAKIEYEKQRNAVIIIQNKFRNYLAMKHCRENYLKLKQSVMIIQKRLRINKAMKVARFKFEHQRKAAIFIQIKFRSYLKAKICRQKYLELKKATIYVQKSFRANLDMKKYRKNFIQQKKAAIIIETKFRAYLEMKTCREKFLRMKGAAIFIQRQYKANFVAKTFRQSYLQQKNAAIFIQQKFRAYLKMKLCRKNYLELKYAAGCLQQWLKAYLIMKQIQNNYVRQRNAAIIIQNKFRACLKMKDCREYYLELKETARIIQRRYRANRTMKAIRKNYIQQKYAAIFIQQKFRAYLERKKCSNNDAKLNKSACVIQAKFREYLLAKRQRHKYLLTKEATIKIQRYFREYRKKCLIKNDLKIKSVIRIQSWVRMHAAKKILATLRENSHEMKNKLEERRVNHAASKIQALWRGYKTRKVMSDRMTVIRQRSIEAANNAAPEFGIGQRNREAIDLLMYQTTMKAIIRALTILDFTTRLFPNLCIEVCDEITERLYILLICTNRSVPDMETSILSVSILINLYKFEPTSAAVWKVQYIERLLQLLLQWSDKDSLLFPYACTLLWLFSQKPENCKIIKAVNTAEKILKKTYQQCQRRQKMLSKMRNASSAMDAKRQKDVLPSVVPDWGIININRPKVFINPVFAIKCLLKKLNIPLCV